MSRMGTGRDTDTDGMWCLQAESASPSAASLAWYPTSHLPIWAAARAAPGALHLLPGQDDVPLRLQVSCEGCFLVPQMQTHPLSILPMPEALGKDWAQSQAAGAEGSAPGGSSRLHACQLPLPASPPGISFDFHFMLQIKQ